MVSVVWNYAPGFTDDTIAISVEPDEYTMSVILVPNRDAARAYCLRRFGVDINDINGIVFHSDVDNGHDSDLVNSFWNSSRGDADE